MIDLLVLTGQVLEPLIVGAEIVVGNVKAAPLRSDWLMKQLHSGFSGSATGFLVIAGDTGANHVFPDMGPAPVARHNMVDGQVFQLSATVLAGELVAAEDFKAR